MRSKKKYKIYSKHFLPLSNIPYLKILKFHRSKWKKIQRLIVKYQHKQQKKIIFFNLKNNLKKKLKNKYKLKFFNYTKILCSYKRWSRYKFQYKNSLNLTKNYQLLFGNSLENKYLKFFFLKHKPKEYISFIQTYLIKMEYRLDILLWRLQIFSSLFEALHEIKNNQILINNKQVLKKDFLQVGDILYIPRIFLINFKKNLGKIIIYHTFLEIDYYTNTVVIVKDLKYLNTKDFFLLTQYFLRLHSIKNFILK